MADESKDPADLKMEVKGDGFMFELRDGALASGDSASTIRAVIVGLI